MVPSYTLIKHFLLIILIIFSLVAIHLIGILPTRGNNHPTKVHGPSDRDITILQYSPSDTEGEAHHWKKVGRSVRSYSEGSLRKYCSARGYVYVRSVGLGLSMDGASVDEEGLVVLKGVLDILERGDGVGTRERWLILVPSDRIIINPSIPLDTFLPPTSTAQPLIVSSGLLDGTILLKINGQILELLMDVIELKRRGSKDSDDDHTNGAESFRQVLSEYLLHEEHRGKCAPIPTEWFDSTTLFPQSPDPSLKVAAEEIGGDTTTTEHEYTPQLIYRFPPSTSRKHIQDMLKIPDRIYAQAEKYEQDMWRYYGKIVDGLNNMEDKERIEGQSKKWWSRYET
ncbi:hypothetical protein I302_100638 [Kwoniella bestiolae CBS 10118]|uniref:Uncharacterized protein n=1 Tax=Kwoniella bestiolae CBS 10118 TaxID=1296100 RepID=A0A1B9G5L9_9TREE|nr:hypothetical protein I302_04012 [Kwoniella bestiolae CBS 10118]OCF26329.1 hypothetical protein I302_04012 [Kwoniella bestiolae CBS 10118]